MFTNQFNLRHRKRINQFLPKRIVMNKHTNWLFIGQPKQDSIIMTVPDGRTTAEYLKQKYGQNNNNRNFY